MLARKCVKNEPKAYEEVNELLMRIGLSINAIWDDTEKRKARELVRAYMRREPASITKIHELLTSAGESMDGFMARALDANIDTIEKVDRLTAIAEDRRNASLREIDRRRVLLGQTLRRSVQEIEEGEFKVIETTPAKRKDAA
jgi:hypothetical protein